VREAIILKLIARADSDKDYCHQIYLLAVACIETGIEHLGIHVRTEVEKRLGSLVPPRNMYSARALAAAGELAVPYLTKQYNQVDTNSGIGVACIHALVHIGSEEALKALKDYAEDAQSAAINELLRGWDVFDRGVYIRSVLSQALRNMSSVQLNRFISIGGFQYLDNLNSMDLSKCALATEIVLLLNPNKLTRLDLSYCPEINKLDFLLNLNKLTELNLVGCEQVRDLRPLAKMTQLTRLNLAGCSKIEELRALEGLTQLTRLNLTGCSQLRNLSPLGKLTQLIELSLASCDQLHDLSPLTKLTQLAILDLSYCRQLKDFTPLNQLSKLQRLLLRGFSPKQIPLSIIQKIGISWS